MSAGSRFNNALRYRDGRDMGHRHLTPAYILEPVRLALGGTIGLDPCTEQDNPTGAVDYFTEADDGLAMPWAGVELAPSVFCNPPYGKAREPWVDRCIAAGETGQRVVLLMPSHTDTRVFQRAFTSADACVFVRGRVKFGALRANRRQEAASHPSVLLGWNVDLGPCAGLGTEAWGAKP